MINRPDEHGKDHTSLLFWHRLPVKLGGYAVLVGLVVGIVLSLFQVASDFQQERASINTAIERLMSSLEETAAEAAYQVNENQARSVLSGLFVYPAVYRGAIIDDFGNTLVEETRGEQPEEPGVITRFLVGTDSHRDVILSVAQMPDPVGRMKVWLNLNLMAANFTNRVWLVVASGIVRNLALATLLAFVFYLVIAKPLVASVRQIQNTKDVDHPQDIVDVPAAHANDELGLLLTSINSFFADRERARVALRASESLFRAVVDHSPTKIHIKDVEGRYTLINPEAEKLFGVTDAEGRGKTSHDLFPKQVADAFIDHDREVTESGETIEQEEEWELDDGVHTFLMVKFPIYNLDGVAAVGAIGTDITDRKKMEEDLKKLNEELESHVAERTRELSQEVAERTRAEQFLSDALESIADGAILYDADDRMVLWNSNYQKSLGELVDLLAPGSSFEDFVRAASKCGLNNYSEEDLEKSVQDRLEKHRNPKGAFELERADGSWVLINEYKTRDGGTFIIRTNITERKRTEAALIEAKQNAEAASRVKSDFLANMSHELRTPLNAIIGFSELMQSQSFGPVGHQKYIEYASDINQSGQHLLAVINDILDLSAIEAGKLELNTEQVGLATLVTMAVQFLGHEADDEGVRIINTVGMDTPLIMADKRRVKQILINLLSNAVKFTPPDGTVTISAKLDADGCMALAITDTGVGMDKKEIARALEPFGRTDSILSRKHEGTGLGLPLSKNLMEAHGGTLEVESRRGKGTTVTARFPAERVIGSEIEEGPSKESSTEKILD